MKKEKELKHYCDTCRDITDHYRATILGERSVLCINWKQHYCITWCDICGKRKDNGTCKHLDKIILKKPEHLNIKRVNR